jgi:hypothetical protein
VPKLPPAFRNIPDGRDLLEGFVEAFPEGDAWVFAHGEVEEVELKLVSSGADQRRVYRGRFALVQLSGRLGGPYGATLSRLDGERVEVVAGTLVRARSVGVSAVCLGGSGDLVRAGAPGSGFPSEPDTDVDAAIPPPQSGSGWGIAAARAAAEQQVEEEEEPEVLDPERGDLIQHFAFGVCEVLTVNGDRLMIRDTAGPGRIREIRIDMLVIHPPTERNGKRLFKLSRRG